MGIGGFSLLNFMMLFLILPLALLPSIVAIARDHPHKIPIVLVNILGGMVFGVGWLVALIWCFIGPDQKLLYSGDPSIGELERLYILLEKGAITQEEYDKKKQEILAS